MTAESDGQLKLMADPGYIPGPKIIPNAALIQIVWQLPNSKLGTNNVYAAYTGSPAITPAIAEQVRAALVGGATWTTLAGFISAATQLLRVNVIDVRSSTGAQAVSTGAATPGTASTGGMPDEVAIAATIRTALRGPGGRGRIYLPFHAQGNMAGGGVIGVTVITAINNWLTTNVQAGIAGVVGAVVLGLPARAGYTSPTTGRIFPARNAQTLPVTQFSVTNNHWDTMRRRGLR